MFTLTPGVSPVSYRISNAEHAAQRVVALAKQAALSGTFGVGGFLMDRSGQVLADAINTVVDHDEICDPTAHAERQLVGTSKNIRLRRDDRRLRAARCRFNGHRPFIEAI